MRRTLRLGLSALLIAIPRLGGAQAGSSDPELVKGSRLVDEGDFEGAIRTLGAVVERLRGPDLSRARLYMGIAQLGLRDERSAKASFLEALKVDGAMTLSPSEFPPRVIEAFEQARREIVATPSPSSAGKAIPVSAASYTQFFEAVKQGDFAAVRRLLTENPALLNAKDERFGATSLHWAALRGHQAIVALLIAQGADGAAKNNDGETALQVADRAKREEVARLLRSAAPAGAAPGDIFEAVKSGDVEGTRRLLEQNPALLNQPDASFGATPLHWAALRGHEEVVRLLVASGADISAKNKDGEMPRQVAERGKRAGVVQLLRQSADSADAIVDAVRAGDLARVQSALAADAGALNRKDTRFGATPLHWAALKGNVEIVKFLVAKGADQNATNRDGETPLRVAERAKRSEVIALLKTGRGGSSSPEGS